jgi:hypothetical protein
MCNIILRDFDFLYKESDYGKTEHYALPAKRDPEKGENARHQEGDFIKRAHKGTASDKHRK